MSFDVGSIEAHLVLKDDGFTATAQGAIKSISSLESKIKELKDRLSGADIGSDAFNKLQKELRETEVELRKVKGETDLFGTAMRGLGATMIGSEIIGGIKNIISAGAEFEQTTVAFTTFLGSADKAKSILEELGKFADITPFETKEVTKAGQTLLAFGVNADDLIHTLKIVGDVASGVGKDFNELAAIFGKAKVSGRVMNDDLLQLTQAGIPAIDELSKSLNVPPAAIRKMAEEGKISFGDLQKSFEHMSGVGGRFADMMEKQNQTLMGLWSNLTSNFAKMARDAGGKLDEWLKPLVKIGVQLTTLSEPMKRIVLVIGSLVAVIGLVIAGYIAWAAVSTALAPVIAAGWMVALGPITLIAAAIGVSIAAGYALAESFDNVSSAAAKFGIILAAVVLGPITALVAGIVLLVKHWDEVKAHVMAAGFVIMSILQPVIDILGKIGSEIRNFISSFSTGAMGGIVDKIKSLLSMEISFPDVSRLFIEYVVNPINTGFIILKQIIAKLPAFFATAFEAVGDVAIKAGNLIKDTIDAAFDANKTIPSWSQAFGNIADIVKNTSKKMTDTIGSAVSNGFLIGGEEGKKNLDVYDLKLKELTENAKKAAEASSKTVVPSGSTDKPQKSFFGSIGDEAESVGKKFSEAGGVGGASMRDLSDAISGMGDVTGGVLKIVEKFVQVWAQGMENKLKAMQLQMQKFSFVTDIFQKLQTAMLQKEIDRFKEAEEEKTLTLQKELNKRLGMIDKELQAKIDALNAEFARKKALDDADFKEKLKKVKSDSKSRNQEVLNEQVENEDKKKFDEEEERRHQQAIQDLISESNKNKQTDTQSTNDAITASKEASDAKLKDMEEAKAKREKDTSKAVSLQKWLMESAMLQVQKEIQIVQLRMATAKDAVMTVSGMAASFGIAGAIGGALLAGKIIANAQIAEGLIRAQFVTPPAELFMSGGGPVSGPGTGLSDSIPARLSNGEFVVNAESARSNMATLQAINDGRQAVPPMTFVFNGAMDKATAERFVMYVSDQLGRRISRQIN